MEKESDITLVKRCSAGDKRAFEALVGKYEKAIFNIAFRVMNDYEDAMDITQSVFIKTYERLQTFDQSRKFFSWLYRIAINEALNYSKMKKFTEKIDSDFPERRINPEERCAQSELSEHVQQALKALKFDYRVVVVLKHFHDLSYKEISEILDIPVKTVKSRLFTGRQLLKGMLIERGHAL
ncbi:MAG: sigma-70 family RNA polymerase sigma factor [Candidatus Latescibacteria bacterium]|nr:sigma-70 family RNA polymerase sigma factor [Candidatus Latescibacterota bacterium]NIO29096.1 sigma-70 family RNA polymerase sigma factor [Candidatus Latescibacterota bacterium]NIO56721.1 sigma-70 family RNA polymerase sigma factor [Candidatus Latescibacterota bacterium]NIT02304.1 sigma-70 family RNA polymerase sigma factor [Candidatus Latescibacterota bacterium]NIT39189.1 sigma-70 family RNA polymerase sigma factor [Candidatus Latescibacterota bacterium]